MKNPIDIAADYGYYTYRHPGRPYMREMQTGFFDMCVERKGGIVYTDGEQYRGRLRRHSYLLGPADTTKSHQAMHFIKDICNGKHVQEVGPTGYGDGPIYSILGAETTWESMRGGFQEGHHVMPIIPKLHYIIFEEGLSFLGHNPTTLANNCARLNDPLESGTISFAQKQAAVASRPEKERAAKEMAALGVAFNPDTGAFVYSAKFQALFCSHPPDSKQWRTMHHVGFLGRFSLAPFDPTDADLRRYYDNQFTGMVLKDEQALLRRINRLAWHADVPQPLNCPPTNLIDAIIRRSNEEYARIALRTGNSFSDIRPKRDYQNVVQMLVAYAFGERIRQALEKDPDTSKVTINSLNYDDAVVKMVEGRMNEAVKAAALRVERDFSSSDPVLSNGTDVLTDFIKARFGNKVQTNVAHPNDIPRDPHEFFLRQDFVTYASAKSKLSANAVSTRLAKLEKAGALERLGPAEADAYGLEPTGTRAYYYKVSSPLLETLGIKSYEEYEAELHDSHLGLVEESELYT